MENKNTTGSKISGIYMILNTSNGHVYIGSAVNIKKRFSTHKANLNNRKHHCRHLQNAWSKYGNEVFEFILIEECAKENLESREQFWLDNVFPEYNIARIAGSNQGIIFLPERRRKISEAQIRFSSNQEERNIRSERLKKQWASGLMKNATEKAHEGARLARLKRIESGLPSDTLTPEQHKLIGEKNKGKQRSEEIRKKMSESHKGKPWTEKQRLVRRSTRV